MNYKDQNRVFLSLLFVSPEDAFWFLIAITERYFDKSYFDQNLSGAQADQEVLKELVELKLPKLSKHLDECGIDLATACKILQNANFKI